jgi:hypothetical protein
MHVFSPGLDLRLRIASLLCIVGGCVPFVVGTYRYVTFVDSSLNPNELWTMTGFNFEGIYTFSYAELAAFNDQAARTLRQISHVGSVNLMLTGFTLVLLGAFGLPNKLKVFWFWGLAGASWVGLNDLAAVLINDQTPIPLIPTSLGYLGLIISFSPIFLRRDHTGTSATNA